MVATFESAGTQDFYPLDPAVRRVRLGNPLPSGSALGKIAANYRRVGSLRRLIRAERPSVLLGFIETANVLCLLAASGLGIPVIVAERIDPSMNLGVPAPWRIARRVLYRRAHAVVAQTEAAAHWLRAHCGTDVEVIPNALRALPDWQTARQPLLLSVGRLDHQKGFDIVLRAFAVVQREFPHWCLAIVGDGPLRNALQRIAIDLGLKDRVRFPGRTSDIEAWYANASVVVQASRFEGFPNVILEAMGMGVAVISTDCNSGPREIITPGHDGLLVPVDDVSALADALRMLMADPGLRDRIGVAAVAVRKRFAADEILTSWEHLLAGAATGPTR